MLISEFDALIGIFVPAIPTFQFGATLREFRLRRFDKVRESRFPDHRVGKLEVVVVAP
jgi:hypothetical protein